MPLDNNVKKALNCLENDGLLSNYLVILLSTSSPVVLCLFIACSLLCVIATVAALQVKHKLSEEDCEEPVDERNTSNVEINLPETYLKLPDKLMIPPGTNRKLSRLSSIAKSIQMKDSEDATIMLKLLLNPQNTRRLSRLEIVYHD